ncbi:Hypothetical Protein XM38_045780 [Halomicronema hongdechloris C2206]|uniref:Putative restriction endonuclease domain-containing protein n=1 Tax=Halomicronema hongdechloris C2206 TaxID=1641165 RepID=A0A1Z3HU10_9CYAN|nr:Uma2 family endonuclease [Halomicronema hongdechloris]ASC73607.1 Hypothetical Protein XM38_045780 [Halomicronema hongdechloris C2206]
MVPITRKPQLEQTDPPRSPRETLPTMYDLPSEHPEEPGLPDVGASPSRDVFHDLQPQLLSRTLRLQQVAQGNYLTASDLNLYYDVNHPLWYKRPDWFLAIHVPRLYDGKDLRRSYVVWQEGRSPYVAIEFLSPGTEREDLGRFYGNSASEAMMPAPTSVLNQDADPDAAHPSAKLEVYERYLRIPHYLVYERHSQQLRYFKLDGGQYQEQALNPKNPRVWLGDLQIGLGIWQGEFEGVLGHWLRWCDGNGTWLLTDAEQAQAQLLQAAHNLLATGMELETVAQLLNLSEQQLQVLR